MAKNYKEKQGRNKVMKAVISGAKEGVEMKKNKSHVAALFIITTSWKQPRCSFMNE